VHIIINQCHYSLGRRVNVSWQTVPHTSTNNRKIACAEYSLDSCNNETSTDRLSADRRCRLLATVVTGTQWLARYGGARGV